MAVASKHNPWTTYPQRFPGSWDWKLLKAPHPTKGFCQDCCIMANICSCCEHFLSYANRRQKRSNNRMSAQPSENFAEQRNIPSKHEDTYDAAANVRKPLPQSFNPHPDDLEPEFIMTKPLENQIIDAVEKEYAAVYVSRVHA